MEHTNNLGSLNYTLFSPNGKHHLNAYASFMKVSRKSYYGGDEKLASDILTKGQENLDAKKDAFAEQFKKDHPELSEEELGAKVDNEFGQLPFGGLDNSEMETLVKRMASYGRTEA